MQERINEVIEVLTKFPRLERHTQLLALQFAIKALTMVYNDIKDDNVYPSP